MKLTYEEWELIKVSEELKHEIDLCDEYMIKAFDDLKRSEYNAYSKIYDKGVNDTH